jgi:hypothetical protein
MSRTNLIAAFDAIRTTRPHLTPHEARHQEELVLQAIDAVRIHNDPVKHALDVGRYRFPEDEVREPDRTRWRDTMASGIRWAVQATEREIYDLWWERGCA